MTTGGGTAGRRDWTGRVLDGRYRIERVLGAGGMGTVYLARDEKMHRSVVVKVPHARLLDDPAFRERFAKEVRALTALSQAHIVRVLDAGDATEEGRDEAVPYAVLEYLEGGSLKDRLERGPQTVEEVLSWLPDVARALDFVHGQGVVHRDIKPGNILFDRAGAAMVADFGIAKALGSLDTGLTQTGATPGSPDYMAPEVALGTTIGPAYDQYALAVVVYEALSAALPHGGGEQTPMRVLYRKASEPPRPLAEASPHVPAAVAAVVMRALDREPNRRYPSCGALCSALEDAVWPTSSSAPAHGADRPPPSDRRAPRAADRAGPPRRRSDTDPMLSSASHVARTGRAGQAPKRKGAGRRVLVATAVVAVVAAAAAAVFSFLPRDRRALSPAASAAIAEASRLWSTGEIAAADAQLAVARAAGATDDDVPAPLLAAVGRYQAPPQLRVDAPAEGERVDRPSVRVEGELVRGRATDVVRVGTSEARRGPGRFSTDAPLPAEGEQAVVVTVDDRGTPRLAAPVVRHVRYVAAWRDARAKATEALGAGDLRAAAAALAAARAAGAPADELSPSLVDAVAAWEAAPELRWDEPVDGAAVTGSVVRVRGALVRGRPSDAVTVDGVEVRRGIGPFDTEVKAPAQGERRSVSVAVTDAGQPRTPQPLVREVRGGTPWAAAVASAAQAAATGDWVAAKGFVADAVAAGAPADAIPSAVREGVERYDAPPTVTIVAPVEGATVAPGELRVRGRLRSGRASDVVLVDGRRADATDGAFEARVTLVAEGEHTLKVTVVDGLVARLASPVERTIRVRARFRDALEAAEAAAREGRWSVVKAKVAEALAAGATSDQIPSGWDQRIRDYERPPTIDLLEPVDGAVVYDREVRVRGKIAHARTTDRVWVNGRAADGTPPAFSVAVERAEALDGRVRVEVRDADDVRGSTSVDLRWSDGPLCPDFTVRDMNGRTVSRDQLRGTWFVLEWVNFRCHFTKHAYDTQLMQPKQREAVARGARWFLVSSTPVTSSSYKNEFQWADFAKQLGATSVDVLIDSAQDMERAFGVVHNCHAVVVDPSGRIAYDGVTTNENEFVTITSEEIGEIVPMPNPPSKRVNFALDALKDGWARSPITFPGKGPDHYG